ncbi:hypothetical protein [Acinetobacter sp. NyZ410]|uniref:hypothetical protein n=1 Tax=Acinetobacter sp. NyZ410 TaxID=2929509 RepID=UPI001FBBDF0F|nr:hypothetical protein [Acinetobacter sp. NyZ410]UOH17209.1 hypothetical protein MTO68_15440 [Acinetobacter sp. NyZ410]
MSREILRPCDYLWISWKDNPSENKKKDRMDWIFPFLFSVIVCIFLFLTHKFNFVCVTSCKSILYYNDAFSIILNFLQTMPGFYIAALAAISTFNNPGMDIDMVGSTPIDKDSKKMTRRRFLAQSFSYLTFLSIVLLIFGAIIKYFYSLDLVIVNSTLFSITYMTVTFILFVFLFQLVFITFYCLYYLGNRIHLP